MSSFFIIATYDIPLLVPSLLQQLLLLPLLLLVLISLIILQLNYTLPRAQVCSYAGIVPGYRLASCQISVCLWSFDLTKMYLGICSVYLSTISS